MKQHTFTDTHMLLLHILLSINMRAGTHVLLFTYVIVAPTRIWKYIWCLMSETCPRHVHLSDSCLIEDIQNAALFSGERHHVWHMSVIGHTEKTQTIHTLSPLIEERCLFEVQQILEVQRIWGTITNFLLFEIHSFNFKFVWNNSFSMITIWEKLLMKESCWKKGGSQCGLGLRRPVRSLVTIWKTELSYFVLKLKINVLKQ